MKNILDQALANGAFQLNEGYYYSYLAEIAAVENNIELVIEAGRHALTQLPQQEVLLRARVAARMADANWHKNSYSDALPFYEIAYQQDPSIFRRLALEIPVSIIGDNSQFANQAADLLSRSPRFNEDE